jgi:hypothetical protein
MELMAVCDPDTLTRKCDHRSGVPIRHQYLQVWISWSRSLFISDISSKDGLFVMTGPSHIMTLYAAPSTLNSSFPGIIVASVNISVHNSTGNLSEIVAVKGAGLGMACFAMLDAWLVNGSCTSGVTSFPSFLLADPFGRNISRRDCMAESK